MNIDRIPANRCSLGTAPWILPYCPNIPNSGHFQCIISHLLLSL